MTAKTSIIIPSYNESQNLVILVEEIKKTVPLARIYVVDDSGENERKILRQKLGSKKVRLIFRNKKSGRGSAVLDGFKEAAKDKTQEYFMEMDADRSHDPKDLPKLVDLAPWADVVIGSRYLPGSRIENWPLRRLWQSRVINGVLKIWLGVGISDYTNGLRLYNRRSVTFLLTTPMLEKGFIALSESAFKLKKAGFTFAQVPTTFRDRTLGKSNANFRELMASLLGVIRIRLRSLVK